MAEPHKPAAPGARQRGMVSGRARTHDYWDTIAHMQASDVGKRSRTPLRFATIATGGALLYAVSGDLLYLVWVVAYIATNVIYLRSLQGAAPPVYWPHYATLIGLHIVTTSVFAAMPLYIWLTADLLSLQVIALSGLICQAVYNVARHTNFSAVSWWDLCIVNGTTAWVGIDLMRRMPNLSGQVCVAFATAALVVFYSAAKFTAIRDREALARHREDLLEAQKHSGMSQITAGVAHDFNNKLTVIQGNIELAAMTHDPAERAARLAEAQQAGEQAARVVASMQAFVHRAPLTISRIDLRDFVETLRQTALAYLPDTATLDLTIDDSLGEMDCDAQLLEAALMNLLLNARDAMAGQPGCISLQIAPGALENWSGKTPAAQGPFLRFDVSDEGPGLPPEAFARVQEPFYSSKPTGQGTGLGLSMVKGFAEQIGGALMLRNRATGGLEVSLILPQNSSA